MHPAATLPSESCLLRGAGPGIPAVALKRWAGGEDRLAGCLLPGAGQHSLQAPSLPGAAPRMALMIMGTARGASECPGLSWSDKVDLTALSHHHLRQAQGPPQSGRIPLPQGFLKQLASEAGSSCVIIFPWDGPRGEMMPFSPPRSSSWSRDGNYRGPEPHREALPNSSGLPAAPPSPSAL